VAKKEKSRTPNNPALITGDIITWARERLGYSHKHVADEIGASVTADDIAQWEAQKALPDFRKAQKLATALHIPFGYLFLSHRPKNDIKVPDLRTVGSKPITDFVRQVHDFSDCRPS
jgi:transcriptional regulator with XRE-family HTH domain